MIRIKRLVAAAGLLLGPPVAAEAQQPVALATVSITAREIGGDLRFLSHDLLEGRAPATRSGEPAAQHIGAVSIGEGTDVVANAPTPPTWNRDAELVGLRRVVP